MNRLKLSNSRPEAGTAANVDFLHYTGKDHPVAKPPQKLPPQTGTTNIRTAFLRPTGEEVELYEIRRLQLEGRCAVRPRVGFFLPKS